MKTTSDYHVNFTLLDEVDSCETLDCNTDEDPFADVKHDVEVPKYYRLNEKVFAEPLQTSFVQNNLTEERKKESQSEITFVGNIGVQKRPGRRNKYFIDVEDVTNLTCPQQNCQKKFSSKTLLKAHVRKIHCADRTSYVCEQCGAGFPARFLLKRHSEVHGNKKVECPVCHKMLSLRTNLSTHLRSHAAAASRPHACGCGRRFVRKSALSRHERFVHRRS